MWWIRILFVEYLVIGIFNHWNYVLFWIGLEIRLNKYICIFECNVFYCIFLVWFILYDFYVVFVWLCFCLWSVISICYLWIFSCYLHLWFVNFYWHSWYYYIIRQKFKSVRFTIHLGFINRNKCCHDKPSYLAVPRGCKVW